MFITNRALLIISCIYQTGMLMLIFFIYSQHVHKNFHYAAFSIRRLLNHVKSINHIFKLSNGMKIICILCFMQWMSMNIVYDVYCVHNKSFLDNWQCYWFFRQNSDRHLGFKAPLASCEKGSISFQIKTSIHLNVFYIHFETIWNFKFVSATIYATSKE